MNDSSRYGYLIVRRESGAVFSLLLAENPTHRHPIAVYCFGVEGIKSYLMNWWVQEMSDFKRGDKITVKGNAYGSHWFIEHLPKGYEGRKCAMVKITHCSTNEKCFDDVKCGIIRAARLIDVRAAK